MTKKKAAIKPEVTAVIRSVRFDLTDDEKLKVGQDLAGSQVSLAEAKTRKKQVTQQLGAEVTAHESKCEELSRLLQNGYEYRETDCRIVMDFEIKEVRTERVDTGEEIDVRAMLAHELQRKLDLDEEEKAA